ncbi:hypothetical protein HOK31_13270 [Candidatus Poribacteria bacterium]|nr:hypothetical protein [Candidatus Poribacteria bacterium]MBT5713677.1 hypothetical protein [Candidatus Poribacteria bacterium]MBT7097089.1 hypothetical protein [Candidatus Poribacteria bacterium]
MAPDIPDNADESLEVTDSASFVGNAECGRGHADAYVTWQGAKRAHVYDTPVAKGRSHDPERLRCHVVGLGARTGFASATKTPELRHVPCEACHGAGGAHVADTSDASRQRAPSECAGCHTPDASPAFDLRECRTDSRTQARACELDRVQSECRLTWYTDTTCSEETASTCSWGDNYNTVYHPQVDCLLSCSCAAPYREGVSPVPSPTQRRRDPMPAPRTVLTASAVAAALAVIAGIMLRGGPPGEPPAVDTGPSQHAGRVPARNPLPARKVAVDPSDGTRATGAAAVHRVPPRSAAGATEGPSAIVPTTGRMSEREVQELERRLETYHVADDAYDRHEQSHRDDSDPAWDERDREFRRAFFAALDVLSAAYPEAITRDGGINYVKLRELAGRQLAKSAYSIPTHTRTPYSGPGG